MEHCGVFPALRVGVEGEAAAQRVHQASWPDVHVVDHVADLSHATLPQIVEKGPLFRIWIVAASIPSNFLAAYQEIPKLVSLLRQLVLDAQVAFVAECASNIDVDTRENISRDLNVKPNELCPASRCPMRRLRLLRLSWKLPAVDHNSVERAKAVDTLISCRVGTDDVPQRGSAQDGLARQTLRCHHLCRDVRARRRHGRLLGTRRVTSKLLRDGRETASNFRRITTYGRTA